MSDLLKALLVELRQHPAFGELLKAVETPRIPSFRPSKGDTTEMMGAKVIYASGARDQHERWKTLLAGRTSQQEDDE